MKRLFLVLIFLSLPLIGEAETIDTTTLPDFSDLKNIYTTLYEATNNEDQQQVVSRVRQHRIFIGEDEDERRNIRLLLDELSVEDFCDLKVPQNLKHLIPTKAAFEKLSFKIDDLCAYEQEVLRLEQDMIRQKMIQGMFHNGELHDSFFDLGSDLNRIDDLIFGAFAVHPEPSFNNPKTDEVTEHFAEDSETWQHEAENIPEGEYELSDISIAGSLHATFDPLEELETNPVNPNCATKYFFEPALEETIVPQGGGSNFSSGASTGESVQPSELSESLAREIGADFTALENKSVKQVNSVAFEELGNTESLENFRSAIGRAANRNRIRQFDFQKELATAEQKFTNLQYEQNRVQLSTAYAELQTDLSSWLEHLQELYAVLKDFTSKPVKP